MEAEAGTTPVWLVAILLCGSGLCALSYQTVWLREFRLVFGASTAASAAVLALFMGGLGAGSLILGPRADAHPRPLQFYAALELVIAGSAALTPLLMRLVHEAYLLTGGSPALGLATASVVRLLFAGAVLLVPSLAMGGTLPAAARAAVLHTDAHRRELALLYGANTLGAVGGALLTTFVLLERCGDAHTLWLACVFNTLVAAVALGCARRLSPARVVSGPEARELSARHPEPSGEADGTAVAPTAPPGFILGAAAVSGFAFFLMELVWYRMLGPLLGGSVFTFGVILAMALLGVGLGGITYTLVSPRRLVSLSGLALTFGLEALCLGFPLALGDRVAMLALTLRRLADAGFLANTLGWCAISGLVILPTALVAGFQFALLLALLGRGRERVGRQVGLAYAWNTIGAMAGSLAGGFGLLPVLSAPGVWRGTVLLLALVSLAAAMVDWVGGTRSAGAWAGGVRRAQLGLASVAVVSLALLGAQGPTAAWRHSSIGVGRADQFSRAPAVERRDQVHYWRRVLLWERDGVESSVALTAEKGISFLVNGKNDGNARFDAGTSAMSGLIGALLHPEPKRAFIVGLGTGTTAGWLAAVPSVQQVDVAELEPTMMRVAQACELVNHAALRNPRIRVAFGDARELLAVARGGYDLVISEPSNPYRAGVASLFTREFYASAAGKLSERGLFLQWVQAYEVDQPTVRAACATLASVFPVVEAWETQASDLLFVATSRPLDYDVASLRARVAQEPFRSALRRIWRMSDLEGFLAHYLSSNTLSRDLARQPGLRLNTDDRTIMEFSFGRAVGQRRPFDTRHWLADSQARQTDRPPVRNGTVDWRAVEDRRHSMFVLEGLEPPPTAATPAQEHRVRAKTRFVNGDFHGALTAWRAQTDSPADRTELLLVAQSLADAGNPEASAYLEPLRSEAPGEAEVLTAHLLWRQGRLTEATAALASAFVRYRSDPWPLPLLMHRALGIAQTITQQSQDRALARRLHTVLGEPFAVRLWDQARLACRFNLALDSADPALLGEAIAAFEPQVPWRRYFLEKRLACYTLLGDPRARRAERDWQTYLASAPPEQDQPRGPLPGGR